MQNCPPLQLDGWWAEAYDGLNGFAIGLGRIHSNHDIHDSRDGEDLYRVIHDELIPLFYQRDKDGLPRGWIKRMKRTIRTLGWRFSAAAWSWTTPPRATSPPPEAPPAKSAPLLAVFCHSPCLSFPLFVIPAGNLLLFLGPPRNPGGPSFRFHRKGGLPRVCLHERLPCASPASILKPVSRRIFQLAGTLILILATLSPLMECFDRWDTTPGPANDFEIHLTAWFVGVGIVLTLAKLLRRLPALAVSRATHSRSVHSRPALQLTYTQSPAPTGSPPLLPLRI
jgi:hypothetical protein